jgi:Uma2 family endonuclease
MATVLCDEEVEIPPGIESLEDFRRWALSDDFPERGRIDYVAGRIEVDMSPEDLFTHGTLKSEVAGEIKDRVQELDLGHIFIAEARVSSVPGDVSAEPDVVVVSFEAEDEGRVRYTPKASGEEGRFVEIDGATDLIVEIISDSSTNKDKKRLPPAYYAAGVRELWLIDARNKDLYFQIFHRGPSAFAPAPADPHGFQTSQVLKASYHLERTRHRRGHWVYRPSQTTPGTE